MKDVLAHIAWAEREALGVLRARALVGSELWRLTDDERNAVVFERERSRTLDDVLRDYRTTFEDYLSALAALTEEELNDPNRIRDMIPGWRPWGIVYDPAHYRQHPVDIERWLRR